MAYTIWTNRVRTYVRTYFQVAFQLILFRCLFSPGIHLITDYVRKFHESFFVFRDLGGHLRVVFEAPFLEEQI